MAAADIRTIQTYLTTLVSEMVDIDGEPSLDASFEELGLDSLSFIEMQIGVAKTFGVQVQPEVFASGKVRTLGDVAGYVHRLAQDGTAAPATAAAGATH